LYRSARTVAEVAQLLGKESKARVYEAFAESTRDAFVSRYVRPDGTIKSEAPTVYALAIAFGLLDAERQTEAGNRLKELVEASGYHVSTGFAGTPYVLDALTQTGHLAVAYRLLLEQSCPSWLYPVTMGATTIWERWDSMLSDGSINPGEMTSFNHYALGAVADWMHRAIGGIAALEPGYDRVLIAPKPGGGITWGKTSLESQQGRIALDWEIKGKDVVVKVELPEGLPALVDLHGRDPFEIVGTGKPMRV
jgi:alpha-L-rhamnosidase